MWKAKTRRLPEEPTVRCQGSGGSGVCLAVDADGAEVTVHTARIGVDVPVGVLDAHVGHERVDAQR